MIQKNDRDTVLHEIHEARRAIVDKFHDDIAAMLNDARKRQAASSRAVWRGKPSNQTISANRRPGEKAEER